MLNCCALCGHCGLVLDDFGNIIPVCITDNNRPIINLNKTDCWYNDLLLINESPVINIVKVKCYYELENEAISCSGLVMLRDDLTFEGIVKSELTNEEKIVIGYLPNLIGMQLLAVDSCNNPFTFNGVSSGSDLYGYWSEFIEEQPYDRGKCRIEYKELGFNLSAIYEITEKIGNILSEMNNRNLIFYKSVIDNKDRMAGELMESINTNSENIEQQECIKIRRLKLNY